MSDCWAEIGTRKNPQAVMRDINQIKYQVFNSRRNVHDYATARPRRLTGPAGAGDDDDELSQANSELNNSSSDCESRASSLFTDRTSLPWDDTEDIAIQQLQQQQLLLLQPTQLQQHRQGGFEWANSGATAFADSGDEDVLSSYLGWWAKSEVSGDNGYDNDGSLLGQMQSIFELDADCNVILQGRIGQGFYGEVYLGTLERDSGKDSEPQQVAVKKLKMRAIEAEVRDFEREIEIMKTLKHPNVVGILGVISEPEVCLVMEFVKHGSLQSYLAIHRESLTVKRLLAFSLDIATGMDYLGSKSIVHRDLAARNILVADENRVKISDFGLAQVTGKNNDYYILQTNRNLPIKW